MAYGGQEVLHVVQHDQRRAALAHAVGDRLQRRADGIAVGADGSGHCRQHLVGGHDVRQPREPHAPGVVVEERRCRRQGQAGLACAAAPDNGHEPLPVVQQRAADAREVRLASDKPRSPGRQVVGAERLSADRRERRRAATINHGAEQRLGRREVLEAVRAQWLGGQCIPNQVACRRSDEQLATVCRGRHARRPMYLQAHVAGRVTLHVADMQPHPHAELPDLGRPTVRPHRPLSAHGRPRASRRLREGRDERVTLRAVDVTAFGDDGASHQRMMVVKDPGPRRTERARQPRGTFYVGEQQRDRPDRRLQRFLHHPIVRRVRQPQRPPRRAMLQAAPELRRAIESWWRPAPRVKSSATGRSAAGGLTSWPSRP